IRTAPRPDAPLKLRMSIGARIGAAGGTNVPGGWTAVCLPSEPDAVYYAPASAFISEIDTASIPAGALSWSEKFLGTPYLWGGSSAFGLDCSGIVQLCYRLAGITLVRDADIQRNDPRFV